LLEGDQKANLLCNENTVNILWAYTHLCHEDGAGDTMASEKPMTENLAKNRFTNNNRHKQLVTVICQTRHLDCTKECSKNLVVEHVPEARARLFLEPVGAVKGPLHKLAGGDRVDKCLRRTEYGEAVPIRGAFPLHRKGVAQEEDIQAKVAAP
jgi:hypothetical protein